MHGKLQEIHITIAKKNEKTQICSKLCISVVCHYVFTIIIINPKCFAYDYIIS